MNNTKRILALALSLVMVLGLLTACGEEAQEAPLRVSLPSGVETLDPAYVETETERIVVSHLYENLMKVTGVDENGVAQVGNAIMRSYQVEEDLEGRETYTFKLRDDAKWSDGKAVTAGDFVYAWRRLVDPGSKSPNAPVLNMVEGYRKVRNGGDVRKLGVKALDDTTLEVRLSHRCPYFVNEVCAAPATMPVRRDAVKQKDWSMNPETLVVNGPYSQVTAWTGDGFTATVNEDYYDEKRLGFHSLDFLFYEDDTADFRMELPDEVISTLPETWSANPYPRTTAVVINQLSQSLRSKDLRLAMALVIDRTAITEQLGPVRFKPAEGLVPYGMRASAGGDFRTVAGPVLDNGPENYEIKCQKARELVADKKLPVIKLSYPAVTTLETVALELQRVWGEELGLEVTLVPMGIQEMRQALLKGDFSVALSPLETIRGDASGMLDNWRSGARKNFANIHYSAYDLLMRISDDSDSDEARDAYLADAEQMLLESGYLMPIYHGTQTALLRDGLTGLVYDGLGVYHLGGIVKAK